MKPLFKFSQSFRMKTFSQYARYVTTQNPKISDSKSSVTSLKDGPSLRDFINVTRKDLAPNVEDFNIPYLNKSINTWGEDRKVFLETYGCQMNVNDTEVIWSILKNSGFRKTENIKLADVILVVTCAIREGAETKV